MQPTRSLDLQLVNGATPRNDAFQDLRLRGIYDPETGGEILRRPVVHE